MAFVSRMVTHGFRVYWRTTRGLALAVEACVFDAESRIALVKAGAESAWQLPGTGVRKGEALDDALQRFLFEDYRIRIAPRPELFWMYGGTVPSSAGLTGLYVVRQWRRDGTPAAPDLAFFGLDALPAGLSQQSAARIRQAVAGRAPFEVC